MSVESEYTPTQTACNGSLTAFSFDFPIFATSDLKVYLKTVATSVKTLLVETTHYSISATNNDYSNGGTVTTVATYSNLYEIIIERDIPYTQPTDLEESGRIPSNTLDATHDRALMQIQQVNNKIQRALVMPVSDDSALDMELPNEIERASQFLAFSADGEPVAANSFDGAATASAYIQTLLVAADAAAAAVTLDGYFYEQGGQTLRCKVIEIGDWNMDTTSPVNIAHGLGANWKNIRALNAIVRNDTDDGYYSLDYTESTGLNGFALSSITSTNITLKRMVGGVFDSATFDSTSYNRGWITIWYEA